jgi:hypothetical protein
VNGFWNTEGDAVKEFIDEIPDSKLEGLPTSQGLIYENRNFMLDMQGISKIFI